jgi:hypothetical protein
MTRPAVLLQVEQLFGLLLLHAVEGMPVQRTRPDHVLDVDDDGGLGAVALPVLDHLLALGAQCFSGRGTGGVLELLLEMASSFCRRQPRTSWQVLDLGGRFRS